MSTRQLLIAMSVAALVALAGCAGSTGLGTLSSPNATVTDASVVSTPATAPTQTVATVPELSADSRSCSTAVANPSSSHVDVAFDDQPSDGTTVVVTRVTLSSGGFVAVVNGTDTPDNTSVLGSSEFLESGTHTDILVELDAPVYENRTLTAVVFADASGDHNPDEDGSDEVIEGPNGTAVTDSATITVMDGPMTIHDPSDIRRPTVTNREPIVEASRQPNVTATNIERPGRRDSKTDSRADDTGDSDEDIGTCTH